MFPVLEPFEIERVRRFGKIRLYDAGAARPEMPPLAVAS